jgi:hypothetical protein
LRAILGKGLAATGSMWPGVRRAFGRAHRAAAVLRNRKGLDAAGVRRRYRGLLGAIARHRHACGDLREAFAHFREVARSFGYEEIDAPIVEHAELFIRKAGEEIVDQLYHFTLHDRHLALRPELTPSLARMVMARQGSLAFPVRWF